MTPEYGRGVRRDARGARHGAHTSAITDDPHHPLPFESRCVNVATVATRGFFGRRRVPDGMAERLPPGQYFEEGFPVLTAGATPQVSTADWSFAIEGLV